MRMSLQNFWVSAEFPTRALIRLTAQSSSRDSTTTETKSDIKNYQYDVRKINAVRFITTNSGTLRNPPIQFQYILLLLHHDIVRNYCLIFTSDIKTDSKIYTLAIQIIAKVLEKCPIYSPLDF